MKCVPSSYPETNGYYYESYFLYFILMESMASVSV